jgi:hypothetical protein
MNLNFVESNPMPVKAGPGHDGPVRGELPPAHVPAQGEHARGHARRPSRSSSSSRDRARRTACPDRGLPRPALGGARGRGARRLRRAPRRAGAWRGPAPPSRPRMAGASTAG